MLLAVDVGNTHSVFGLYDGETLRIDWRITTGLASTADELGVTLKGLFREAGIDFESVDGIVIASVVPDLSMPLTEMCRRYFGHEAVFIGPGVKTGVPIHCENPHEVGADRIVNAVAARERFGAPVVVVDFGTTTNFDVVGTSGAYIGGVIAPGVNLSAEALFNKAARLHPVDIHAPETVIGKNTEQCVRSGLFFGYVALVEGLLRRIRSEIEGEVPVVATGGVAVLFRNAIEGVDHFVPTLTLDGLRRVWEQNRP
ncbi:MAG: type III pantothenate kinase [Acidobacteriota bacterium]|nr:type III pantothenate kinase [Acidobacteriota bacterium]